MCHFEVVTMATQEDQFAETGILTNWMKGRKTDKSDQSAFSPIEVHDSFIFYYQHLKSEHSDTNMQLKIVSSNLPSNNHVNVKGQDSSKHPSALITADIKNKSSETDNSFKEEDCQLLLSPNSTPKSKRKSMNQYFTGAFTSVDKSKGCWILSNLSAKRDKSLYVGYIGDSTKGVQCASSTSSIEDISRRNVYRAKPSELREMNFWSPTSM